MLLDLIGFKTLAYSIGNIFLNKDAIINEFESWDRQMKSLCSKPLMNTLLSNPTYDEENSTD